MSIPGTGHDRGPWASWNDQGVGHALEAMLMGALVLGAIGFTIASQAPPPPSQSTGSEDLEEKAWEAVQALDKMHYPDEAYGHSLLSYLLAQAAGGNSAPLDEALREFMPPGVEFQMHLHNGYDRFPVYTNKSPTGQAVGVSYPMEPRWKYHYGATDLRLYNANLSNVAMGHTLIPIFHSNHVRDQGETVQARGIGEMQPWNSNILDGLLTNLADVDVSFEETGHTSLIQGDGDALPSASIYMQCERGGQGLVPCYASDLTLDPMDGYGPKAHDIHDGDVNKTLLGFEVENNGPGPLPDDTNLHLSFPVGLEVGSLDSPGNAFDMDTLHVEGNTPQPQTVTVELTGPLEPGETGVLDVWVSRTDDRYAYKKVHASLSEGAASTSQLLLVVEDKEEGTLTGGDTRDLLVSTPRPAGAGDQADGRWALVLPTPVSSTNVTELALTLQQEGGFFEDATFPSDFNPTYPFPNARNGDLWVTDNEVLWTNATIQSSAYEFVELQVNISTDGTPLPASSTFPAITPSASFLGYHPPNHFIQQDPGIWWQEHPPEESTGGLPGFGAEANDPSSANPVTSATATNILHHRNHDLQGETTYRVANLGQAGGPDGLDSTFALTRDSTQASKIETEPQRVPPGGTVAINIDSRDLALYLSQSAGLANLNMATTVYAPWGVMERTPAQTYDHKVKAAAFHDPITMLKTHLTDHGEDLIVASSDGNIYGIDGETGSILTGRTFPLPASQLDLEHAMPTVLAATDDPSPVYGIGTSVGLDRWYAIDHELNELWSATKPEGNAETVALGTGMDLTADGVSEFVAATKADDSKHRLLVHDGNTGELLEPWEAPTYLRGDSVENVGFANLGVHGEAGIWADSGWNKPGLSGFYEDGSRAWTFQKVTFDDVQRTDRMDLGTSNDENPYQGLVATAERGWLYGFNSSKALPEATGNTWGKSQALDVAFSNHQEGYYVAGAGLVATRDAGTSTTSLWPEEGLIVNAVDTPPSSVYSGPGMVSWWAGDAGVLMRSPDRLSTATSLPTDAIGISLEGDLSVDGLLSDELLNLEHVNFRDVHAVSEDEAWFVGAGIDGTALEEKGIIAHTQDAGESLTAYEVPCEHDGELLDRCGINAIDADEERLWIVGESGLVLTEDIDASAANVQPIGSQGFTDEGAISIHLAAGEPALVENITLSFSFDDDLKEDWARGAYVTDASGDRDLWNKTNGGAHIEEGTHAEDKGATSETRLLVESYAEDILNEPNNRILDGTLTLHVGPFHADTDPPIEPDAYYTPDDYVDQDLLPMNFTILIDYEDGSSNLFEVRIEDDLTAHVHDETPIVWTPPSTLGFETPNTCFGDPEAACLSYTSINATHGHPDGATIGITGDNTLGLLDWDKTQATLIRKDPADAAFEPVWDPRVNRSLNDVAINPKDPHEWVLTAKDLFYARSQDLGKNWTVLPPASMLDETLDMDEALLAVDHTPDVPTIVGGHSSHGLIWQLGGYHEHGEITTANLLPEDINHKVESLSFNDTNLTLTETRNAHATVGIYDPGVDTENNLALVHTRDEGTAGSYTFEEPVSEVTLLLNFSTTTGYSPRSAQVEGQLGMTAQLEDTEETVTFELDFDDPDHLDDATLMNLDYDEDHGFLRLEPARNPWVWKLGNYNEGPWSTSDDPNHGAQPTAMDLSPDGQHAYVGTGPIRGGLESTADVVGYDNTLYKINVTTGLPEPGFDPDRFPDPIHAIDAGEDIVHVATAPPGEALENVTVYNVGTLTGDTINTIQFDAELDNFLMRTYDAGFEEGPDDDVAIIVTETGPGDGHIAAYKALHLEQIWLDNPSVEGYFEVAYEVPRNALYGAHVIVTELRWNITDTYGNDLLQTARLHNSFDVTPPTKQISLAPTYNLELLVWMDDW